MKDVSKESSRRKPRCEQPRNVGELKINELPKFVGGFNPEKYLDWEKETERVFQFKCVADEWSCKYAILRLRGEAELWYEKLKAKRTREGKGKLSSWESLKRKL